jgi:hypothetical protein
VTRCPQSTPGHVHALCPADDAKKPQQISLYGVKTTAYEGSVLEDGSNLPAKASDQSENRRSRVRILGGAMKFFAAASAALALTAAAPSQSQAATGTVRLHVVKAGLVLGGTNGDGFLYIGHRRYHLSVTGSSIGTVGVATLDLVGTVSNLRRPSDIAGSYSDAGAGVSIGAGPSATTLQNDHGVILQLQGPQTGLQVSLSLGGMTIAMR